MNSSIPHPGGRARPFVGDLRRLRAPLAVALLVAIALLLLNSVLSIALSLAPEIVPIPTRYLWEEFQDVGGRIGDLEKRLSKGKAPDSPGFGLVVGTSSVRRGVSATLLEGSEDRTRPWIVLAGGGPDLNDLRYLLAPLRLMKVRPEIVALGTHPNLLADLTWRTTCPLPRRQGLPILPAIRLSSINARYTLMERLGPAQPGRPSLRQALAISFQPLSECLDDRNSLSALRALARLFIQHAMYGVRLRTFAILHHNSVGLFPSRPYKDNLITGSIFAIDVGADRIKAAVQNEAGVLSVFEATGKLDPANYRLNTYSAVAFRDMLDFLCGLGATTSVVLMPEHSRVRGLFPPEARSTLLTLIENTGESHPVGFFDLSASVDDGAFRDEFHLSDTAGRPEFSRLLARALVESRGRFASRERPPGP